MITPNTGHVELSPNRSFVIKIAYPNSYYEDFSNNIKTICSFKLLFKGVEKILKIELDNIINNIRT